MEKTYGTEKVDEMIKKKFEVYEIETRELEEKIKEYKEKVKELLKTKKLLYD